MSILKQNFINNYFFILNKFFIKGIALLYRFVQAQSQNHIHASNGFHSAIEIIGQAKVDTLPKRFDAVETHGIFCLDIILNADQARDIRSHRFELESFLSVHKTSSSDNMLV
ncbi:MAG: hypothetical protein NZZ41_06710 [Candidatus Dojkabacteria bacterium]|nr:hypothetical protein [Candidatus Dojkabacteria bacterium]